MSEQMTIGFIGNPNCGKTTLFNAYTGANLKVANWPGVTVEKVEGAIKDHDVDTRLVEIVKFLKGMECKKIGLAFCKGLTLEAREVAKVLEHHGFEVVSVICKNGAVPKADIGVEDENTLSGSAENEVMCNPIGQAMTLNKEKSDFNIIMGLCVGHDTLFLKYAEAPVTVFAVKDRVTGHNPLAAVYCANSYYKKKLYGENK